MERGEGVAIDLIDIAQRDPIKPSAFGGEGDTLSDQLVRILKGRDWTKRELLAFELSVSVRHIREAASVSNGRIVCGNSGLKLTSEASAEEVQECLGRFTSQIHEMSRRVCEIRDVFEACRLDAAAEVRHQTADLCGGNHGEAAT